jgi:hypothetical protein
MGSFRFYRRVHIFPGLTVKVSRSGPSLSVGVRGAHVTVGRRCVTRTVGIPGTGVYLHQPDRASFWRAQLPSGKQSFIR